MEFSSLDVLDDLKQKYIDELNTFVNQFGVKYHKISQNTLILQNVQEKALEKLFCEVDKGISASNEIEMHCRTLDKELDGIENLAKQIKNMRKKCEDLEKKLFRTIKKS